VVKVSILVPPEAEGSFREDRDGRTDQAAKVRDHETMQDIRRSVPDVQVIPEQADRADVRVAVQGDRADVQADLSLSGRAYAGRESSPVPRRASIRRRNKKSFDFGNSVRR
jgi:hypothetical protein